MTTKNSANEVSIRGYRLQRSFAPFALDAWVPLDIDETVKLTISSTPDLHFDKTIVVVNSGSAAPLVSHDYDGSYWQVAEAEVPLTLEGNPVVRGNTVEQPQRLMPTWIEGYSFIPPSMVQHISVVAADEINWDVEDNSFMIEPTEAEDANPGGN